MHDWYDYFNRIVLQPLVLGILIWIAYKNATKG
ncbi:Uncharacterised protein [Anaerobiospirillum thomasii]|uniref:Uncharacterized protein n=1 Tax=Anaerobiospirillum thomasii TaxID=179995 RepID=A0A2X0VA97_9GAMM|nr:Uncharacterised protein [Anaerobiospirillum thomasii]